MKIVFLIYWISLSGFPVHAQPVLKISGNVINESDGKAIGNCSIFINNSSRGTTSNDKGEFELTNIPAGQHELVISSIGFQTSVIVFSDKQLPLNLHIALKLKPAELESVTVNPFLAEGWAQWGKFFLDQFIGTYGNAGNCFIRNKDKIRFRLTDNHTRLRAVCDEPLIIENRALGYLIYYSLEEFVYDLIKNTLVFTGYPTYREMESPNEKTHILWEKNRKSAYQGSINHFFRSLYANRLAEEGFYVKQVLRAENFEKSRIWNFCRSQNLISEDSSKNRIRFLPAWKKSNLSKDSLNYFEKILKQPSWFEGEDSVFADAGQIVLTNDLNARFLFFRNKLVVYYRNAPEDPAYVRATNRMKIEKFQKSIVYLLNETPVSIGADGSYYPPQELFISFYWAWLGKISNRLPVDYESPPQTNERH